MRRRIHTGPVPSNADVVLGARAVVTAGVSAHEAGMVKVNGEVWRALPAPGEVGPIGPGTEVTVESVEGVTLRVRR
jgi:membrane protein implicated in regulation of membrane protease activity